MNSFIKILRYTFHTDLDNLSLTCRSLYRLALPSLQRHRALQRQYSTIFNDAGQQGFFASILRCIFEQPSIGLYIMKVVVNEIWTPPQRSYSDKGLGEFARTLVSSNSIPAGQRGDWVDSIQRRDQDPVVALLIRSAPNIVDLYLAGSTSWRYTEDLVVNAATYAALSKLSKVHLNGPVSLSMVLAFSRLPSIRSLSYGWVQQQQPLEVPYYQTHIKDLVLSRSTLDSNLVHDFLAGFDSLETFVYGQYGSCNSFNAWEITRGLFSRAGDSLRVLHLRAYTRPTQSIGSLIRFAVLEHLEIDLLLLFPVDIPLEPSRLAAVLPRSIQWVSLYVHSRLEDGSSWSDELLRSEALVKDIAYLGGDREIANLKTLELVGIGPSYHSQLRRCDYEYRLYKKGITFSTKP